jgi:hypothetical protein
MSIFRDGSHKSVLTNYAFPWLSWLCGQHPRGDASTFLISDIVSEYEGAGYHDGRYPTSQISIWISPAMVFTESLTTIFIKYEFWYPVKYPPNTGKTGAKHQSEEVRYYDDSFNFFSGKKTMDSLVNCFIELCKLKGRLTVPPNLDLKPAHQSVCSESENFHCQRREFTLSILFKKSILIFFFPLMKKEEIKKKIIIIIIIK